MPSSHRASRAPIRLGGAALSCLLLVGCGSTVATTRSVQVSGGSLAPSQSQGVAGGADASTSGAGAPLAGTTGTQVAIGSGSSAAGGAPSMPTQAASLPTVTGSRNDPVKIGFMTTDFSAIAKSYGFSGSADVLLGFKDIVYYLNHHGGLAGHRIVPDWYYLDATSPSAATAFQAACTHFVEDVHVQAVVTDAIYDPNFEACLAKANVPHLDAAKYGLDARAQKESPNYLAPTTLGTDLATAAVIDSAVNDHLITGSTKVGVLLEGCPINVRAFAQVWAPQARQRGFQVESVQTNCNSGASSASNEVAQIQSSVLKFRTDGVSVVNFLSQGEGFLAVLFAQEAQNQGWHPQYLLTSISVPERGVESQSSGLSFPPGQFPQIHGVGWVPMTDVLRQPTPTAAQLAQQRFCKKMSPSEGGADGQSDGGVRIDFVAHYRMDCDTVLLLQKVLAADGGLLTASAVVPAFRRVVNGFVSSSNLPGTFSTWSGRTDGQSEVAPFGYDSKCGCMVYTAGPRRIAP